MYNFSNWKCWSVLHFLFVFFVSRSNIFFWDFSYLKELRNCVPRIICVWSLFYSIWVYESLHFLSILLKNFFFSTIWPFCVFCLFCVLFDESFINFSTLHIIIYIGGCSSDSTSSYFFRPSKIWSMLHYGSVGCEFRIK